MRVGLADDLGEPRTVVPGFVNVVTLGRCDDAAETSRGLFAQPHGLEGVKTERRGVPVRLAQTQRQVDQRQVFLPGDELVREQFLPANGSGHGHSQWVALLKFLMKRCRVRSRSMTSSGRSGPSTAAMFAAVCSG